MSSNTGIPMPGMGGFSLKQCSRIANSTKMSSNTHTHTHTLERRRDGAEGKRTEEGSVAWHHVIDTHTNVHTAHILTYTHWGEEADRREKEEEDRKARPVLLDTMLLIHTQTYIQHIIIILTHTKWQTNWGASAERKRKEEDDRKARSVLLGTVLLIHTQTYIFIQHIHSHAHTGAKTRAKRR